MSGILLNENNGTYRMNVATALNSKYVRYTYVMLTSLFINNPHADIHVYLLHSELTVSEQETLQSLAAQHQNKIHFLYIDRNEFSKELPTNDMWSLETYFRLKLLDIVPSDVERLLYLDVDMIINKDLRELYLEPFDGNYFVACKDMTVDFPKNDIRDLIFQKYIEKGFTYFNAGLMLWNISDLRGNYCFADYMTLAKQLNYQMLAPDQDLLNFMHYGQVKFVDEYQYDLFSLMAYNFGIRYAEVKEQTSIIHFAGYKPWQGEFVHYDIEQLWWDYAKQTPFYYELMEEFLAACIGNPLVADTMTSLSEEKKNLAAELSKSSELCNKLLQLLK